MEKIDRIKNVLIKAIPIILISLVILSMFSVINASDVKGDIDAILASSGGVEKVDDAVNKVWGTILSILQIAAVAAIVIAGVRYMFASADEKADIKKGLGVLVVGAILVFAASTVVQFIVTATDAVVS